LTLAFAKETTTRAERVEKRKSGIDASYDEKQREFIDFVLTQYIEEGVAELAISKLPDLIELKYQSTHDAVQVLGSVQNIRDVFIGFQQRLYAPSQNEGL
jgi:type I restriction enzyme R subunit